MCGMPHMRKLMVVLLGMLAASVDAGLVYRFSTKSTAPLQRDGGGRVWIEGDRMRLELDPDPDNPRVYDVAITKSGKTTYINLQNRTYFESDGSSSERGTPAPLFHLAAESQHLDGKPKVKYESAAGPVTLGRETIRHRIRLRYRVRGEIQDVPVRANVGAEIVLLTAPAVSRFDEARPPVHTGFAEMDDELAKLYASFDGMVLRQETSVNSSYAGGTVFNTVTVMSIDELQETAVKPELFTIPAGLRHQGPVFAAPGR